MTGAMLNISISCAALHRGQSGKSERFDLLSSDTEHPELMHAGLLLESMRRPVC
jgi:hypothetical protein